MVVQYYPDSHISPLHIHLIDTNCEFKTQKAFQMECLFDL
jgi:hypothetical protein